VSRTDAALLETERAQAMASDPQVSAWVSANAGAGKTHVLKLRVLKLLLAATPPERILCLTYTKAAAAEMAQRVFGDLARWAVAPDSQLDEHLVKLLGRIPDEGERAFARQLFARALETPGGLKFETIHAFCERLLQRFPVEAAVPPGFVILDEMESSLLLREAIDDTLAAAMRNASPLAAAVQRAAAFAAGDGFDDVLREALGKREWLERASRLALRGDLVSQAAPLYAEALSLAGESLEETDRALAGVLADEDLTRAAHALATGSSTDRNLSAALLKARAAPSPRLRIEALRKVFTTAEGNPRSRMTTKAVDSAHPGVDRLLTWARDRFCGLLEERKGHLLREASLALLQIADAVHERYADAKARRAALDFEDLIMSTVRLLGTSEQAQWVLYKLDGGLDHILVDEAQDTSPGQWKIIEALAQEFSAGAGSRGDIRTLFAVGDEKQSIYSFQGAAPRMFAAMGGAFAERAAAGGQTWHAVPLTLSFRSTEPILRAVDRVFADPARTPGLSAHPAPVAHHPLRARHAGLVEIWPTETWQPAAPGEPWSPLGEQPTIEPAVRLAARIAALIEGWLKDGERLASEGRPVRPGDILILVRKRRPFAPVMVRALKSRGIPVAGSDRMKLNEQLAVQDLMALGDFLMLPEDDLALAAALKSPLFGLDDDDLLTFAPERRGSLWSALLRAAPDSPRLTEAAETLKRWRMLADFSPPYEFFARLLDKDGMRSRLLTRLGPDAADAIDEFLAMAMAYDDQAPASLAGFLHWLRRTDREVKRDMEHGRDEVRVMTVHGAKGLEAPIVFLPDTCTSASGSSAASLVALPNPVSGSLFPEPYVWPVKGTSSHEKVSLARARVAAAEAEEHNRLLYVALTRARDRLYIAGYEPRNGRPRDCWYDLIRNSLEPVSTPHTAADGRPILRLESPQTAPPEQRHEATSRSAATGEPPRWVHEPAPREPVTLIPLSPSRTAPLDVDAEGEPLEPRRLPQAGAGLPSPLALGEDYRFLRGTITHALLEHLPSIAPGLRLDAAQRFVAAKGAPLPARVQEEIVREAMAIITDVAYGALFGPESRAEVPIAAEIPDPQGRRAPLRIIGQIDRLVRLAHEVLILDYKTNRPPPAEPKAVAAAYVRQLAAYRLVMQRVFPRLPVRAAILWTDGPRLMEIPADIIDSHAKSLWDGVPPFP
jgi:ATP-dependent helicase/nuclease subunit A